jgi:hypothetical protein
LPPRYTVDSIALWKAAINAGWQTERITGWKISGTIEGDVAIYGEPLFAATIAEQLSLALLRPPFDWLIHLPQDLLKRNIQFTTLSNAVTSQDAVFIKPADEKCFPAKVYEDATTIPGLELLPKDTPVLVAEPVKWLTEFRCFVINSQVMTASIYAKNHQLITEDDVISTELDDALLFANQVLSKPEVTLPPAVVMDVGYIEGRGWAVIEANPVWGSGIYGCDPARVLEAVAWGCKPIAALSAEDKQWV